MDVSKVWRRRRVRLMVLSLALAGCGGGDGGGADEIAEGDLNQAATGPSTPRIPDESFPVKCAAEGVLLCEGFDNQAAVDAVYSGRAWTRKAEYDAVEDAAKMFVLGETPADTTGSLFFTFPAVRRDAPGEQHIWTQFKVKYPQAFLDQIFYSDIASARTTSWKTSVMWGGSASCSAHEFTLAGRTVIGGYTRCGAWGFGWPHPQLTVISQPGGDTACIYRNLNPRECLHHQGDTWATFTYHINLDTYFTEIWVKYDADPVLYKVMEFSMETQPENLFYDHIYLSAYMTGKDAAHQHPDYEIWYDDLIISTEPIALPVGEPAVPAPSGAGFTSTLLVDFGATESANVYGTSLTQAFHDRYESYTDVNGGGIKAGSSAGYNHSGVMGAARSFRAGDRIRVSFYNDSDTAIPVWPTLSFQNGERGGALHLMRKTEIAPGTSGFSEYTFTTMSADTYPAVNVSVYSEGLIVERIEHLAPNR